MPRPKTIKCLWCGQVLPLTHKGRPKQHRSGAKTCVGSGQHYSVHENQRALIAQARNSKE